MGIDLLRCDDRLIHGQCIVRVISDGNIDHIILVDDFTATSPVMANIYKMSVPPTVTIDLLTCEAANEKIEEYANKDAKTLVLVKDPCVALALQEKTDCLPKELNIGPMSNRNDTKKFTFYAYLLENEVQACDALTEKGIRVYFRQVPDEKEIEWVDVR
ncbi:mannose/fructose/N-acetylgalactosamine-specific phosphotransferase system component IIB [Breznakia sp. PF5-3]|uniref:PTS system mannose/fructose/N-acetylgalactosamine-transporter subunit IIB n=1 Tax=unclassified Breznakia TaxID=2623764 RepID=UPI002404F4E3|nr:MULTISPECIES: PTS sugar transporter subunit IIB [unclassified Breznakia]MDF9825872.1 mannose/fructose/N-acetylgalactosamine-specific phosphotransferase system component IIB [Breznakia sp. PM6-1]MDF9836674.1 mannose/fructose/N-acetylgalactosamine-specific phosphotransferase system component IIB [Breznakia sp. PF5-3]MDF9838948.1 mannose/fructose/N-acetylgalactosamine-specific phosphotransferase system component IIB [Breznakia sp. PFB2-8]MDF9860974.1 mannose/fructose/N-acetylgalactosamine-speci